MHNNERSNVGFRLNRGNTQFGGSIDSGPRLEGDTAVVASPGGLLSLVVQDLSVAFFSQEVLHGERALGDARARLEALWDKLTELTEERDEARRGEAWGWVYCLLIRKHK